MSEIETKPSLRLFKDSPSLAKWLADHGAEPHVPHSFVLEKGMGERLELTFHPDSNLIRFDFYGQILEQP